MEEVDTILIRQLKDAGCPLDDDKVSIRELDANDVIGCAAILLRTIFEDETTIPTFGSNLNMATKYKYATDLASKCSELGFKGDLGYQTFLYGAESDLRRLFVFLIEKLPKDDDRSVTLSTASNTKETIRDRLKRAKVNLLWLPPMHPKKKREKIYFQTKPLPILTYSKSVMTNKLTSEEKAHIDNIPLSLDMASLLEWNSMRLNPDSYIKWKITTERLEPVKKKSLQQTYYETKDTQKSEENVEDSTTSEDVQENYEQRLKASIEMLEKEILLQQSKAEEDSLLKESLEASIISAQEQAKRERSALMEIMSSDKSISDLKNEIKAQDEEMTSLREQWETIEDELVDEISQLKNKKDSWLKKKIETVEELAEIKNKISEAIEETKRKEILAEELQAKIPEQMPPGRGSYTKRIIEIVNNVKKQNNETNKVLFETRALQKEINNLEGKVQRAFAVTDEMIFRDAKSSEWHRKCYKLLAGLHDHCDQIIGGIGETGVIKREILRLEEVLEKEQNKMAASNLVRIQADLKQLQIENQKLTAACSALAKQQPQPAS